MKFKQWTVAVISLTILMPVTSGKVFAEGENTVTSNIQWQLSDSDDDGFDDTLTISGSGDMPSNNYEWSPYANSVTNLIIGDEVTNIGHGAFKDFKYLENVSLGKNITKIEGDAFLNCISIKQIEIPENVSKIGWYSFRNCTALKNVVLSDSVTDIGYQAFEGCTALSNVEMSESLENIGERAFYNCTNLKRIVFPLSLKTIGSKAFSYSLQYSSVNLRTIHYPGLSSDWSKVDNKENIGSSMLHYVAYHQEKSATCTTTGYEPYWTCNLCGKYAFEDIACTKKYDSIPKIPALGHKLDQGTVTKNPSCVEEGMITYACTREGCEYTETQKLDKTQNHLYNGKISYRWSNDGKKCTASVICSFCGNADSETVNAQEKIITLPTCETAGKLQYIAKFVNPNFDVQYKEEAVAPLDHINTEIKNKKELSCEQNGYTGDIYCKDCGKLLFKGEVSIASGHEWNDGIVEKKSTCQEEGIKVYTCLKCDERKEETLPRTEHEWKDVIEVKPTCTQVGKKSIHCSMCNETKEDSQQFIPALRHNWSDPIVEKSATCSDSGIQIITCLRCGEEKKEEIPATGHSWVGTGIVKQATCVETGESREICKNCRQEKATIIPALGHEWNKDCTIDKESTCTSEGLKSIHCRICNAKKVDSEWIIPKKNHSLVQDKPIPATCEKTGKSVGSHCTVCGKVLVEQQEIRATGHSFSPWVTEKTNSVFTEESQSRYCSVCGKRENRNVGNRLTPTMKVSADTLTLKIKQKTTAFKVTNFATGDFVNSWESSNAKVVRVYGNNDGTCRIVAGKVTGKAVIRVTLKSGLTKNIVVTVQKKTVKTSKITNVPKTLELEKGVVYSFEPTIYPITSGDKTIYKSNNKKIVTIDSKGRIKTKKKGKATITIKSGKKSVKCKIKVK